LSVFRLLSDGFKVDFTINSARLLKDKKVIATGSVFGKMFYLKTLDGVVNHSNPSESTFLTKTLPSDDAILWHNRLGHLSLRAVKKLSGYVDGLKIQGTIPDTCLCEACIIGKLHWKPFLPVAKRSTTPMSLIHSDVVGPFQVRSHRGNRYMVLFTDDYTRWSDAYYIPEKSNVLEKFQIFEAKMENLGHKIQYLRTDGGGEYSSAEFIRYLDRKGITRQITAPHSPASNGVAERTNRGILDPTRSMLKHAGVPLSFWAEAAAVAVYIKNRVLHRALDGKSPFEALYSNKPDIRHLRTFGCLAYAQIPTENREKLDDRAKRCIFIGYMETASIWKLYDLVGKRAFTSRDVIFDDNTVYKHLVATPENISVKPVPPVLMSDPDLTPYY